MSHLPSDVPPLLVPRLPEGYYCDTLKTQRSFVPTMMSPVLLVLCSPWTCHGGT